MVGAADLAREEATWLRRVRVKTTAVTAKTAARSGRSARLERAARKSVGRRTGMRTAEPELQVQQTADAQGEQDA
jgi:glucokinase